MKKKHHYSMVAIAYGIILAILCSFLYFDDVPVKAATTYVMYNNTNYPLVDGEMILAYMGDTSQVITHLHTTPSGGLDNNASKKYSSGGGCFQQYYYHSHTASCYEHNVRIYFHGCGDRTSEHDSCGGWSTTCPYCGYQEYHIKSHWLHNAPGDPNAGLYGCNGDDSWDHWCGKICGMENGANYSCNCGLSTSTVVATINARLDEQTGEMVYSVKGKDGTVADYADGVTWSVKAYEMDETTLDATYTLSGDIARLAIEYPKYAVTCSFKDYNHATRSFTIPTYIASIYNLRYTTANGENKPLNVYLNGQKLRAVYYCNKKENLADMLVNKNRDYLIFGY